MIDIIPTKKHGGIIFNYVINSGHVIQRQTTGCLMEMVEMSPTYAGQLLLCCSLSQAQTPLQDLSATLTHDIHAKGFLKSHCRKGFVKLQ